MDFHHRYFTMESILSISILIIFLCFGLVNGQNYNVFNFGAKGDGQTDDSKAFVQAWNAACGGEGDIKTLLIPSDTTFLLQPIVFQGPCKSSSIKVQLNGVIVAPSNIGAWSSPSLHKWIGFSTVSGLMLVGSGNINGRGSSFWEQNLKASQRPTALHISKCDNLRINGITSIDSPKNHISIRSCNTVAISNINLFAPEKSPNTDGIDISNSTNINIFDSAIQTGDDCIAINSGSSNINITGINCGPGHGISVGSLGAGGAEAAVSDIQVTHCTFNQTTNGARIKTWLGGQGYARNISFEDITLINAKNPIIIDQQYADKGHLDVEESAVAISNVKYVGFHGTTSKKNAITLKCSETTHCKDVTMDGINITMADGGKPKIDCQFVDGKSSDTDLMRDCFKNTTSSQSRMSVKNLSTFSTIVAVG
ncbi:putative polygalacturonase [Cardamine amara subsp. amara]|uniref:Polygalacturonase n=1 Tax=Cardamine amara subsp. amara TaxID=228776 RepID=A0ABD1BIX8_CARAN